MNRPSSPEPLGQRLAAGFMAVLLLLALSVLLWGLAPELTR